jgi:hypothetical protein
MTDASAADGVASGLPYSVVEVDPRAPHSLDQFLGNSEFVINKMGTLSVVCGQGTHGNQIVRFHEKSDRGAAKTPAHCQRVGGSGL